MSIDKHRDLEKYFSHAQKNRPDAKSIPGGLEPMKRNYR
jgi:hypothetical protein